MTSTTAARLRIDNAETFADMLADPRWGEVDTDAIGAYPGRLLITSGDTGPRLAIIG